MDPLSIFASITAIVTAAAGVANILTQIRDKPRTVAILLTEVNHVRIICTSLHRFLDRTQRLNPARAALIQLEDVVIILTQTVLVFSELETIVAPLASQGRPSWWRLTWAWQETAALRLVNQLQRHKTSLSLVLQIIQWYVYFVALVFTVDNKLNLNFQRL